MGSTFMSFLSKTMDSRVDRRFVAWCASDAMVSDGTAHIGCPEGHANGGGWISG
jgi:hypothetical protein